MAARLDMTGPSSLAPAGDGIVYVAHQDGVSRVDTTTGRATLVRTRKGTLPALARIRWDGGALLGVEQLEDGTCRILRVRIEPATGRARAPQVLASGIAIPAPSAITLSDNAVYFVGREDNAADGAGSQTIVKRIPLGAAGLTEHGGIPPQSRACLPARPGVRCTAAVCLLPVEGPSGASRADAVPRQLDCECRPLAAPSLAAKTRAPVHLDEVAHQREAEAEPAHVAGGAAVALVKALEDVRQHVRGMPRPESCTVMRMHPGRVRWQIRCARPRA